MGLRSVLLVLLGLFLVPVVAAVAPCYDFTDQSSCEAANCFWEVDGNFTHCEQITCFIADFTNQTYCETTLNNTFNLSCGWQLYGTNLCDPIGGDFFGSGCSDFNNDEQGCYDTYFCLWNATNTTCFDPGAPFGGQNPSCAVLSDAAACGNITGCSWDGFACSGNNDGIQCDQLNKTICNDFTLLSTCCSWNGTTCKTSFNQECYNSIPPLPTGATFCEDSGAFNNQTLCQQIAGSPWYFPCKWQNTTQECHFNSDAFGGGDFASFDEIGTELGCEAQGGIWVTEQYTDQSGVIRTDSWCEFNYGFGGNCDASCWACESEADPQTACQNSALGYCAFQADTNAPNGVGWCNPKQAFIEGGGKSCNDDCAACEFLESPQQKCQGSFRGCVWVTDTQAPNGAGFCFGQNEKRCDNDCFSCYTQNDCQNNGQGGSGACQWDGFTFICKPTGYSGEVCFDGIDNDNDGNVDCSDADCATNKFCGGESLEDTYGNCPTFQNNVTCSSNGCVWLPDESFCDFPGAQCFQHDDNESACNAESGCGFINVTGGFCGENETQIDSCSQQTNSTACGSIGSCEWITDAFHPQGGFCDTIAFSQCFFNQSRQASQTPCEANVTINGNSTQICGWTGSHCEMICFTLPVNECTNATGGLCEVTSGLCEPNAFGGSCFQADGNQTKCQGELNATCTYFVDPAGVNNVTPSENPGWCDPKGEAKFVQFVGEENIVILGGDGNESGIIDTHDIQGVGLKDDFDKFIFGIRMVDQFVQSGTCNGVPTQSGIGSGNENATFFLYIDADGNTNNNCAARDNSSLSGFEFSFKYRTVTNGGNLTETKTSYRCINGNWGAVPVPLFSNNKIMCNLAGGAMIGIDKAEMFKFKNLYNKSKDIRVYASVNNQSNNDTAVSDAAGPFFYTPGAFDFAFEDCTTPGGDIDGDGLTASNDPDCFDFLKFGYVPHEAGYQCDDGVDNDADGLTDCNDKGCVHDPFFCGGTLQPDPNDKTAPKVVWQKADTFPDSAYIVYDTNEPANGTLQFFFNDSSCVNVNTTIRDIGVFDSFVSEFKLWHDGPIDNFAFNSEALGYPLTNATTYYYKTKVCDISGNCAISGCLNFTTRATLASCKKCTSTFNFPFTPLSGAATTDPLGNVNFKFQLPDGSESTIDANAAAGTQFNYSQTKKFNLIIQNPNATNGTKWQIKLVNASVTGKVSTTIQNFSGGDDISYNSTTIGSFVGMSNTKCQELINTFRPSKLEIGIPGNVSEIWQCNKNLEKCVEKTSNATRIGYNASIDQTIWQVPAEWGC